MLLAVVLSFPICSILMLVTVSLMPLALTLTNYVCRPYENIIYETADITHISLLDDTMRVIWPWNRRGKWFGNFLAGSTLTICNGGRMLEVIKGDYQDSVNTLAEQTFTVQQLLLSLTVDPRLIFSVDHPELKFFEKMKSQLWDHVDKITEKFILWILRDVNDLVHAEHAGNPPCFAAYKGYEKSLGILCRGIIRNVNAFWTALGFCLWMFLLLGTVSHFLSKYFLRMVNWTYDGSEVESYTSTSSSSSSKSENKDGTSSPKAGAGKEEAKATVPGDHPVAVEPSAGAEPHKETSKEGPKEIQPANALSPGSPSKEQRTLPKWDDTTAASR
ncbi:hypothetical protein HPB50_010311 [Hyalomma asiaticum]|uniref:Uncharacterized protein n=1 Tax=Hyalomma asiaticum TaxID=266040 RepID=A0ACB7SMG9_HYAAI|nr:hypothetical protein HPB50_010311 [Hyalomma asiaticum]